MRSLVFLTSEQKEEVIFMYVDEQKSILDIHRDKHIPISTVRNILFAAKKLRTVAEAFSIAKKKNKFSSRKGIKKGPMAKETKDKLREKAFRRGDLNAKGKSKKPSGYIVITRGKNKGRLEHIVVIEEALGRKLEKNEVVHHIDGNKENNDISNLMVMDYREHARMHALMKNGRRDKYGRFQ